MVVDTAVSQARYMGMQMDAVFSVVHQDDVVSWRQRGAPFELYGAVPLVILINNIGAFSSAGQN